MPNDRKHPVALDRVANANDLQFAPNATLRAAYAEFAEVDRLLAEAGMSDYSDGLTRDDDESPVQISNH